MVRHGCLRSAAPSTKHHSPSPYSSGAYCARAAAFAGDGMGGEGGRGMGADSLVETETGERGVFGFW